MKLDLRDKKIIFELEKNARIPITDISKKLGISKQLVSYKLKRLEEHGIIKGYTAIIDNSKLGLITFRIYLKFQNLTKTKKETLINSLKKIEEVPIIQTIDGIWDIAFLIVVKSFKEFHNTWIQILKKHKQYINKYLISIYSPIFHMARNFLSPTNEFDPKIRVLGTETKVNYDSEDVEILKELVPNARAPITDISKKLNKSVQFIINRIKALEKKGIIQGYRPILDWNKLGYIYYKVELTLNNFSRYDELFEYCKSLKYIFQIDQTVSPFDFEIEIYAKSKEHFREITDELQEKFSDTISYYSYFTLIDTYKEEFFPKINLQ